MARRPGQGAEPRAGAGSPPGAGRPREADGSVDLSPDDSLLPDVDLSDRLVAGGADAADRAAEGALRPGRLDDFVGQVVVREQLSLVLEAARARDRPPDHVLLSGPPGLGKTTLAMIIASEMGSNLRLTSGPAIQHAGDLAAVLTSLESGDVLFVDEVHRVARPAEELLYVAMEDYRVDVVVGKGPGATAIPLDLPPFTLVGATTRAGLLPAPLRDRFGFTAQLDFYSAGELQRVLHRSALLMGVPMTTEGAVEIARRSRGTPRIANRLLRRVRDWAQVRGAGVVDEAAARAALKVYEVDEIGLDRLDRAVLRALCVTFRGQPVGLSTLAVSVGEEPETVETVVEPFLVREGLLGRTPRGRVATEASFRHLGLQPPLPGAPGRPGSQVPQLDLDLSGRDGGALGGGGGSAGTASPPSRGG